MGSKMQMAVLFWEQGFWVSPAETPGHKPANITAASLEMYLVRHSSETHSEASRPCPLLLYLDFNVQSIFLKAGKACLYLI